MCQVSTSLQVAQEGRGGDVDVVEGQALQLGPRRRPDGRLVEVAPGAARLGVGGGEDGEEELVARAGEFREGGEFLKGSEESGADLGFVVVVVFWVEAAKGNVDDEAG